MDCYVCPITAPPQVPLCEATLLPGGLKGMILIDCDANTFSTPEITTEWVAKKTAGTLYHTSFDRVIGQMPESSPALVKVSSCCPPELVNITHNIELIDRNAQDPTQGSAQDAWYNFWNSNFKKVVAYVVDCNDLVYQVPACYSFAAVRTKEDNNTDGMTFWKVMISFIAKDHPIPIYVPGLSSALINA